MKTRTKNEVNLIARLGKDAELKRFPNGGCICKLTAATDNSYKDKTSGEWIKETDWHNVIVKGSKAQEAAGLRKGEMVSLTGRLKTRSYEANGEKRYVTEVHTYEAQVVQDEQPAGEVDGNKSDDFWA